MATTTHLRRASWRGTALLVLALPAACADPDPTLPGTVLPVTSVQAQSLAVPHPDPAPARRNLGLRVIPATADLAAAYHLARPQGLFVLDVLSGAAAAGGLQPNDIVLAFDGRPVAGIADLQAALDRVTPGTVVHLSLWRDSRPQVATLTF